MFHSLLKIHRVEIHAENLNHNRSNAVKSNTRETSELKHLDSPTIRVV